MSSKLSVGIIGLTNVGKSTLFNALASRRLAETAPRPFTTIDPHEAIVPLADPNLEKLAVIVKSSIGSDPKIIPATVTFIDIAGLVKDAHKGEGLGNKFLAKIREVDALIHVVRAFEDEKVSHQHPTHKVGSIDQIIEDIGIVNFELELGDVGKKPVIFVLNVEEGKLQKIELMNRFINSIKVKFEGKVITISAKMEEELIDLNKTERMEYLKELGVEKSGLEKLIVSAYKLLDLSTFYTIKGGKELHAWSLKKGLTALEAAEKVHTDFAKNFIKAEVISVNQLLETGSWKPAKENGLIHLEGKDYTVQDKDVIEFKV